MGAPAYAVDLLVRLSKYAPTERVTPLENFVTEAFAYALRACRPLRERFLARWCGIDAAPRDWRVDTQVTLQDGLRPDMLIVAGTHRVYIENKVWSDLNQYDSEAGDTLTQVERYVLSIPASELRYAQLKLITSRPVFALKECSRGTLVFRPCRDHIRWADVYRTMQQVRASCNEAERFLLDNLSALMEEHEMDPIQGIGKDMEQVYESYKAVSDTAAKLHGHLLARFTALLDEIIQEAGASPGRHSTTATYTSATVAWHDEQVWLGLYFDTGNFLKLDLAVGPETCKKVEGDRLVTFTQQRGCEAASDGWMHNRLCLPKAAGEHGGREQIERGAGYLRGELGAWQALLASVPTAEGHT